MKYRKKPVVIEAWKMERDRESIANMIELVSGVDMSTSIIGRNACIEEAKREGGVRIETLEGTMLARFGDYVIQGISGEFYPCKPDIFEQTYDRVGEETEE